MASLPIAYGTALYGLEDLARLRANELVLILPGTGTSGGAAIHLSKTIGANVLVVAEDQSQVEPIMSESGLRQNQVISQSDWVRNSSSAKGDVVFSSGFVDDSHATEAWRSLAPFGCFVNCGRKSLRGRAGLDIGPIVEGTSYLSFDMVGLCSTRPGDAGDVLKRVVNMYRRQQLRPLRVSVHGINRINGCVAEFSSSTAAPKVIIEHTASDQGTIEVLPVQRQARLRGDDATYFMVGCLGGLGPAISSCMMK
jgi:NADPH:quinone reductase-like Zn-dependent oxidoreductase